MKRKTDQAKLLLKIKQEIFDMYEHSATTMYYCDFMSQQYKNELESLHCYKMCSDIVESHMPKKRK